MNKVLMNRDQLHKLIFNANKLMERIHVTNEIQLDHMSKLREVLAVANNGLVDIIENEKHQQAEALAKGQAFLAPEVTPCPAEPCLNKEDCKSKNGSCASTVDLNESV